MISVVIVGTGNVAKHLFDAFSQSIKVKVNQVVGRNKTQLKYFKNQTQITTDFSDIIASDILIIAVSDDTIGKTSEYFINSDALVVHTSGNVSLEQLKSKKKGVFYPLQSFTQGQKIDFESIPICIEVKNKKDFEVLELLAKSISNQVFEIALEQRRSLHLAAVFVNNFTNHLYQIGYEICEENDVPFDLLKPLIQETSKKIVYISPNVAQTGPARRNDTKTLHSQLALLKKSEHHEVYKIMTNSIKITYGKKL